MSDPTAPPAKKTSPVASTRVLSVAEMKALDASADVALDVLIERAGAAVAAAARSMLKGGSGRNVVVLAGIGNNGADGRAAAKLLTGSGINVRVIEVSRIAPAPDAIDLCDLVIDAVHGTGFSGSYRAPNVNGAPVLAVDLPSGLDATSGTVGATSRVLRADRTVTFGALKPGLLFGQGPRLAGAVRVVDIGLPPASTEVPGVHIVTEDIVRHRVERVIAPAGDRHKWSAAVGIVGGSALMAGAPALVASGAQRGGAGMVVVGTPAMVGALPVEVVAIALAPNHWAAGALEGTSRCHALVVGPGLGRSKPVLTSARSFALRAPQPIVIDADAFSALSDEIDDDRTMESRRIEPQSSGLRAVQEAIARRQGVPSVRTETAAPIRPLSAVAVLRGRRVGSTVLTPHDGEYEILMGRRPGLDRIAAARDLAAVSGAVVLLKGATTVVSDAEGRVELVRSGDDRLATAGTGDVLAGIVAAFLAQGLSAFDAAVCGSFVHGAAALRGTRIGFVASDLPVLVAALLSEWAHS